MDGYGQYCPVAKAAEVVDRRWTLLVLRELLAGSTRFNDLHRGVPRMSRTQLSTRLRQLADTGLVIRQENDDGPTYELTDAGQQFRPVIEALGEWGLQWLDSLSDEDFDPALLLWDVHRRVDLSAVPEDRTVVAVDFHDLDPPARHWWLVITPDEVDVCDKDPGHGTDVTIRTRIRSFVRLWRGDLSWPHALREGSVEIQGPTHLRRQVPSWLQLSYFAPGH